MPSVILFDVNETLLDLSRLDEAFADAFGKAEVRQGWFAEVLRLALITTITGPYADFSVLGQAALGAVARRHNAALSDAQKKKILGGMSTLPPHPEVPAALRRLAEAGFRLAALTNSPPEAAQAKLQHAGLAKHFEHVLSADAVERLKPAPEPYRMAARRLGVPPQEAWFVAAHDWDIAGAMRAGCRGAFVARPGKAMSALLGTPGVAGPDLQSVADQIIAAEGR